MRKYVMVVVSGLSDLPSNQLGGRTPLEAAQTPHMDSISMGGRIGLVETLAEEGEGGSDQAMLSLLGYDPSRFPVRRGPLEATGLRVKLEPDDLAMRLNFVSTYKGILADHNAGQISTSEARSLIKMLNARLGSDTIAFHAGLGYRHLLVLRGGASLEFKTVPPHEALHQPVVDFYPYGGDAEILSKLMDEAHEVLRQHDINLVRVDLGENPANRIWLWGEGRNFELPAFDTFFPLKGAVIGAVPLLEGIARKIGFDTLPVAGATGYVNTDYEAKAREALRGLERYDLVIIHVGAVNEVCHQGDLNAKVKAIEDVDRRLLGPLLKGLDIYPSHRIMVTTDHITPAEETLPLKWPVPVAFRGEEVTPVREYAFSEANARKSDLFVERASELMEFFLGIPRKVRGDG